LILDSLGLDSAYIYKDRYNGYLLQEIDFISSIINSELYSINAWLERSKNKEISSKIELINQKELAEVILKKSNSYLDSISSLNIALVKSREDSLAKEVLHRIKDSSRYKQSLLQNQLISNLEKTNHENEIQGRNYIILGIIALILLLLFFFQQGYQALKRNRQNEINRINYLVQNNIHNFRNDYATFSNLIDDGNLEKLEDYNENYGDYIRKTHENWTEEKIPLADELEAANYYYLSKKVRNINLHFEPDSTSIASPESTLFLQSVFDTIIHNSIKHGFMYKEKDCRISARIYKEDLNLICIIEDNGQPPPTDDVYLSREDSGLNLLRKRIDNLYKQTKRKATTKIFTVKSLPNNAGTQIKMVFPYEEI
jgi:LytS/YehU family sensor histidine kinase